MPRKIFLPDWFWWVALAGGIVVLCLTGSLWFLVGLAVLLLVQGIYVFHFVRCPGCHARLTYHQDCIPGTRSYHFQLTCKDCHVHWDTGKVCGGNACIEELTGKKAE